MLLLLIAEAVQAGEGFKGVLLFLRSLYESRSSACGRGEIQILLSVPNNRTSRSGLQH